MKRTIFIAIATLTLAAGAYGPTRGSFERKVAGKSLDEAIAASGKLARQEARTPGETVLVYEKKTFDADMSAKDAALPC